jgi:hypothetical protein
MCALESDLLGVSYFICGKAYFTSCLYYFSSHSVSSLTDILYDFLHITHFLANESPIRTLWSEREASPLSWMTREKRIRGTRAQTVGEKDINVFFTK